MIKAFDLVLRELVFGYPHGVSDSKEAKLQYLIQVGMSAEGAEWILAYLEDHGCACEQWGVHPQITELMNGLHTKAWCTYGELQSKVVTVTGGRQGCKLGAHVFGSALGLAISVLQARLRESGMVMNIKFTTGAFWQSSQPDASSSDSSDAEVLDAIFIDNTIILLVASSPQKLKIAITALLAILLSTFSKFKLSINWGQNETEAFLMLRGKHASDVRESFRQPDGNFAIPVPGTDELLRIVPSYKHLGSVTLALRGNVAYAAARASTALSAYCPLATRILVHHG